MSWMVERGSDVTSTYESGLMGPPVAREWKESIALMRSWRENHYKYPEGARRHEEKLEDGDNDSFWASTGGQGRRS